MVFGLRQNQTTIINANISNWRSTDRDDPAPRNTLSLNTGESPVPGVPFIIHLRWERRLRENASANATVEHILSRPPESCWPFPRVLQGILVNLAVAKRYGVLGSLTEDEEPPVGCTTEAWLLWVGIGGLVACVFLRVYRCHSVLVLQDGFMWPVLLQFALVMTLFLVPPTFASVHPSNVEFDEDTHECERQSEMPEAFAVGVAYVLAIVMVTLTVRLRAVKLQVTLVSPFL